MEFPDLGKHCYQKDCKRLDFLPMKCDACSQIFCNDHIHYNTHLCPDSYKKDNQVPVCPLCNKPIPLKKGEVPDVVVGRHIDSDCQSDPAKERRKVYTNKCSMKGCKVKEMIPVKCEKCHKNYCLRHRFEDDHNCQGFDGSGRGVTNAGAAAISRLTSNKPQTPPSKSTSAIQPPQQRAQNSLGTGLGQDLDRLRRERQQQNTQSLRAAQAGLSEEELMALAIQQSLAETQGSSNSSKPTLSQEEEDMLLAQALAASDEEARRQANRQRQQSQDGQNKKSCHVS